MPQQVMIEMLPEVEEKLGELPTATTMGERQLALHYTAAYWNGIGDVFENGPLLGGATRALAMGMQYNPNRQEGSRLQTYDWFSLRQALDLPDDVWSMLVGAGLLTMEQVNRAHAAGTFLPLFEALHEKEDYWELVSPHVGYLPGHRDDIPVHGEAIFHAPDREFGLAFVDGCKSWYGTKHWFREIAPHLLVDADILFQDFGHYTCFWLPVLVGVFREHFELIAYVDCTYIWRLKSVPSAEDIELLFPDEPTELDRDSYETIFKGLIDEAVERGDRYAVMILQAQLAAAYAYIGLKDAARDTLDRLLMVAEYLPYRPYLKNARISPTYTPEERIEL